MIPPKRRVRTMALSDTKIRGAKTSDNEDDFSVAIMAGVLWPGIFLK
jgi:hypothetical protein